ncbi:MAG: hypothetical protein JNM77_15140 [Pseudonocardia sp.]|nr:hypothetical protein [Pseudonocardia sp.]
MLLYAPTPRDWLATHGSVDLGGDGRWLSGPELVADGLRAAHARLCAEDVPSVPAAKWVVAWYAGGLAETVGFMLALADAAPLVDLGRTRWRQHPDGWPELVDPGPVPVVVPVGHPWAGRPDTFTAPDVAAVAVRALVAAAGEVVEVGRMLARVGRTALWAEVADGLGLPLLHRPELPVDQVAVERLRAALALPGVPWRKRPDLRADGGLYLGRKGGCCLSYQCPPDPEPDPATLDERDRAYRERFPPEPRAYCSTCSLRDLADCEERQRFWVASAPACGAADRSG